MHPLEVILVWLIGILPFFFLFCYIDRCQYNDSSLAGLFHIALIWPITLIGFISGWIVILIIKLAEKIKNV